MRLIDADALKKTVKNMPNDYYGDLCIGDALKEIDDAPTIDAVPVVRGEWIDSDKHKGWKVCSVCKDCYVDNAWVNGKKWRYCPNCGAKMESEGST